MKPSLGLILIGAICVTGCTDSQLRVNTVRESLTAFKIDEQQVLDNLAQFVCDYNSMPSFCYPNLGSSIVTDAGNAGMRRIGVELCKDPQQVNSCSLHGPFAYDVKTGSGIVHPSAHQ